MAFPLSDDEHHSIEARIVAPPELVIAAAIRVDGLIVSVERPGRHGEIISLLFRHNLEYAEQGFLTSHGRFVDRIEAGALVVATGQGTPREISNGQLFSEDLWNNPGKAR